MRIQASHMCSAAWSSMTVVELKAALRERGLKVSGKKADLIERLGGGCSSTAAADANQASATTDHNSSDDVDVSSLSNEAHETIISKCASLLQIERWRVAGAISLFNEGSTMPFVARYRKESTGGMDETELRSLEAALDSAKRLEARRASILSTVDKQGKLTEALRHKIADVELSAAELEDLYLPFRAKRRTKASMARDAGLQPLADAIMRRQSCAEDGVWAQYHQSLEEICGEFAATLTAAADDVRANAPVAGAAAEVLRGACEIVAEEVTEDAAVRAIGRAKLRRGAVLMSKEKKAGSDAEGKFKLYHAFRSPLERVQAHQALAINRGEALKVLSASVDVDDAVRAAFEATACRHFAKEPPPPTEHASWRDALSAGIADGVGRLLLPALEREWRRELTDAAEEQSFSVYSTNLRQKLLQPPLKGYIVAAIDPGLRTGCKLAVVSPTGGVLATDTLMLPLGERAGGGEAKGGGRYQQVLGKLIALLSKWKVSLVAIGNGTGNREASALVIDALTSSEIADSRATSTSPKYLIVDESGASVYSASKLAVAELPSMDVSIRGAVSLARRVQDPLSELVKVDPKSLGQSTIIPHAPSSLPSL